MKRVLLILSAVLTFVLGAADAELLKLLPAKYEIATLFDVEKLLKLPFAKSVLEDGDVAGATAELEKSGVKLSDIRTIMVFAVDDKFGVAMKVANGVKIREMLDASPNQEGFSVEAMQVNGRRLYRFSTQGRSEKPVCTFVSDELIFGSDTRENLEALLAVPKLAADAAGKLASGIPAAVAMWGEWRNLDPAPAPDDQSADDRLEHVRAMIDFTGKELRELDFAAEIRCYKEKFANALAMMIPGYIAIGSGMAFADAPELNDELMKGVKIQPEGKVLKIKIHLSEKVLSHLVGFSTQMAKEQVNSAVKPAAEQSKTSAAK